MSVRTAQQPGCDGYLGVEAAMAGDGCERKFQHALAVEVEAWREKQLAAEILALHGCARPQAPALSRHQRLEVFGGLGHSAAVPSGEYAPWQPVHDGGMICRRGATPAAAPHRLATAEQGQGVGGGG